MNKNSVRASQLYLQAKRGWRTNQLPFFNSEARVPTELLFDVMLAIANVGKNYKHRSEFRQEFYRRVRKLLDEGKDFDENYLGSDIKKHIRERTPKKYLVYFGVPIKTSPGTPLPFGKEFIIDGVEFKQISLEQFERPHKNKDCLRRYYDKFERNLHQRQSKDFLVKDLHYIRARVSGSNYNDALRSIDVAFRSLYASATVAENFYSLKHSMMGGDLKSRSILFPMGIMMISTENHEECELAWDSDIRVLSEQAVEFTKKVDKLKKYRVLRQTFIEDSPISLRIKKLAIEYSNALHSTEPHIRQLGLWRCLEIATSKQSSSRPEAEIIQIIASYHSKDEAWRQRGKIIKNARNDYVHNGAYLEQDEWGSVDRYLNWTQEYVDTALNLLLAMRKIGIGKKSEAEIDAFFDQYPKTDEELLIAKKIIQRRTKRQS